MRADKKYGHVGIILRNCKNMVGYKIQFYKNNLKYFTFVVKITLDTIHQTVTYDNFKVGQTVNEIRIIIFE